MFKKSTLHHCSSLIIQNPSIHFFSKLITIDILINNLNNETSFKFSHYHWKYDLKKDGSILFTIIDSLPSSSSSSFSSLQQQHLNPIIIDIPNIIFNLKHIQIKNGNFLINLSSSSSSLSSSSSSSSLVIDDENENEIQQQNSFDEMLNISLNSNSTLNIDLSHNNTSTLTIDLLDHSRLNVKGSSLIKKIFSTNIATNAILDISQLSLFPLSLSPSSFSTSSSSSSSLRPTRRLRSMSSSSSSTGTTTSTRLTRSSSSTYNRISIDLNFLPRCTGSIIYPIEEIIDEHYQRLLEDFFKPKETTRQKFVREQISFPHEESDCTTRELSCPTCLEYDINAQYKPCGHIFNCLICAERLRSMPFSNFTCPLCRQNIDKVEKIN